MKIKLEISQQEYPEVRQMLENAGFEITEGDDADFIMHQSNLFLTHLPVRNRKGEKLHLPVEDIITLESFGHNIDINATGDVFQSSDSLKGIQELLDPKVFVRISNSVIINRRHIKEIIPTFSMKFKVRMDNGSIVEVTRSYYHSFREFFNI